MRAAAVTAVVALASRGAVADPLPPGAIQFLGGGQGGVGVDAARMGYGYLVGCQAEWQPMQPQQRVGWAVRWLTMFGGDYGASAGRVQMLRTVIGELTVGARFRPGVKPGRYITLRGGFELLRSNQIIPDQYAVRDFAGPVASVGLDQYGIKNPLPFFGDQLLLSVDVHYGMIANGPSQLALVVALGFVGP